METPLTIIKMELPPELLAESVFLDIQKDTSKRRVTEEAPDKTTPREHVFHNYG